MATRHSDCCLRCTERVLAATVAALADSPLGADGALDADGADGADGADDCALGDVADLAGAAPLLMLADDDRGVPVDVFFFPVMIYKL